LLVVAVVAQAQQVVAALQEVVVKHLEQAALQVRLAHLGVMVSWVSPVHKEHQEPQVQREQQVVQVHQEKMVL